MALKGQRRRIGFAIVEVVIVMMSMGIVLAFVVPKFCDSLNSNRANSAAKRVKADLGLARRNAQLNSAIQTVAFRAADATYELVGKSAIDGGKSVVNLSQRYGATIETAEFGGSASVSFDAGSVPDNGGEVTIRCGDYTWTVYVASRTGTVTIQ